MSGPIATLRIDGELCQGHGRCYSTAPDLFEADDVGTGLVSRADLDEGSLASARRAQAACPEEAIFIELSD